MATVGIAERSATILWRGDVVVVGAGTAGVATAVSLARKGIRVCLLESGPVLGREVSGCWRDRLPGDYLGGALHALCAGQGGNNGEKLDVFIASLAFDQLIQQEGLTTFVRLSPARLLTDADGVLSGVEVVGKSGRQAVQAPVVIDATPWGEFSRRGLGIASVQADRATRRFYLFGIDVPAEGRSVPLPEALGAAGNSVQLERAFWEQEAIATFSIPVARGESRGEILRRTLDVAGDITTHLREHTPEFAHATFVDIAPEIERDGVQVSPVLPDLAGTGLHVLLADQDGSEANSAELERAASTGIPLPGSANSCPAGMILQTSELTAAPEQDLETTTLPAVWATLHDPVDVVVAGYGTGGAYAALAAADTGASVIVLDPAPFPGGIGTGGRIHSYYHGKPGGIQDAVDEQTSGMSNRIADRVRGYNPMAKARILSDQLAVQAADVCVGSTVFGVVKEGNTVNGVIALADSGYHVYPCTVAIDATGDADLAAASGAAFALGREGDGFPQPYSYTPTVVRDGVLWSRNFDAGWVDPTDTLDFSRAHFEGRRRLWEEGPFTEEMHHCCLASIIGLRESRFIKGDVRLTFSDFLEGARYPDTVCESTAHYDNHAIDYAEESDWAYRHVVLFGLWRQMATGELPYRCLYPAGVDGVLVGCRAISIDHDLHQLVRMQRDLQKIGEICGVAAAKAARDGVPPAGVDVAELCEELTERGVVPPPAAEPAMAVEIDALLDALGTERNGLAMWRLSQRAAAVDWDAFFTSEVVRDRAFAGAVAAAAGGISSESVRSVLSNAFRERIAEPALGIKSPPPYVVAALALAEIRAPEALPALCELLQAPDLQAAVAVLVLKAIGRLGDKAGVVALKAFLVDGLDGASTVSLWGVKEFRLTSFRFAVELRAVRSLLELGCADEVPRLEAYVDDGHLLIRRYARRLVAMAQ
ncbi:MAG: FAD-dependent oxidoreductase [Lentisphaerae bacterium]|jgi:ribulose 1,5-bisphosphate synthetase/thiazole synthase|nr:FAD-dependent oxidoreductase [Lentisphaerota bacterium]MBT4821380.1 FAD-dependent oxidoreductase [Lentisphaerota bacterium]MBT5610340.1 FAD-dependent oxidoreductase [Lentisphaerota bacterium]MBT7056168.1 FAD-dependent oxidoreductase [Lentisphaerota bacterium]MBT7841910.1 FAD-dependent oxidoreductase [Lentisphaerota bacterium]